MGEMQLVGGAMIFVDWMTLSSLSAGWPWTPRGGVRGERPAALQMPSASRGDTRLKSLARNPESQ